MLHIRLRREGKKKQPIYRLIVTEKTKDPWGDYLENLGTYNPRRQPSEINFNVERIKAWLQKGAQTSETVRNILIDQKIIDGAKAKTMKISKKRKQKLDEKQAAKAEAKAAAEAAPAAAPEEAPAESAPEATEEAPEVVAETEAPAEAKQEEAAQE